MNFSILWGQKTHSIFHGSPWLNIDDAYSHKVVVRNNAFSTFPSAPNESESKGEVENERLKCPFSHVERHLDLQKIP
jgi:hypothetical protein